MCSVGALCGSFHFGVVFTDSVSQNKTVAVIIIPHHILQADCTIKNKSLIDPVSSKKVLPDF